MPAKTLRTCRNGHRYYKSSDCPTCPVCAAESKPAEGLLANLPAPARRALQGAGITTAPQLSKYSEQDILKLHGIGPASLPSLRKALHEAGLHFR